ncbi:hypothetical protein BDQ17DRAFT_1343778 [Cyathus striatus]|nr:hypothetical protein BDQ17DRAFT_1343778 [Cyathus striatus]
MSTSAENNSVSSSFLLSSRLSEFPIENSPIHNVSNPSVFSAPLTSMRSSTWQPTSHPYSPHSSPSPSKLPINNALIPNNATSKEREIMNLSAARFAARLALDHQAILHPDVDTPFADEEDVVNRLLPYHVVQHPQHDSIQSSFAKAKGKGKASELKREIEETEFALQCFKRREALRGRFRKIKIRAGKHSAPSDQAYVLAQAVLETDRSENTWLTSELRSARSELERIEREKRAAAQATRMVQFSSIPATATQSVQPQYYHRYPYAYTQTYGAHIPLSSTSTFPVSPAQSTVTTPVTPNAGQSPYQSSGAIPVQLPVSSLPALHALGIVPVPATSLPPEGQPQPPAVLRGSTANGVMLSLEINVSLLLPPQMSGLAMILNSLMSRSISAPGTASNSVGSATGMPSSSMSTTGTSTSGTNAGT